MKKLKFILCVGILGVMTYGGITAYNHLTMTEQERLLLANVEALTSDETGAGAFTRYILRSKGIACTVVHQNGSTSKGVYHICEKLTNVSFLVVSNCGFEGQQACIY